MLIDDLNAAFADVKYPENSLSENNRPSEWDYLYARLQGKHWRDLTIEDLDTPGGSLEGVQCLSAEAFVYFLPGMTKLVLNDSSLRYPIISAILTQFTYPDSLITGQFANRASAEQALLKRELAISLLSHKQRQFLIEFLVNAAQHEPTHCPVIVNAAIQSLREGKATIYLQDDVNKWAQQFKQKGIVDG